MATAPANNGADSHVLREYLVSLGFRIDEQRHKSFTNTVSSLDKTAGRLGASLVAVGSAAVGMAVLFTRSMERLFYNARYADTTVAKLQALEFAGRNIGLAGGEMTAGVKSFAASLRANPGLVGMLEKMGVPVKGRDMSDVMWDFVRATKSMPFYVAQQFAEMFGMSPETLFNMQKGEEAAREAMARRAQMAKDMGVDADELAKTSVEISNIWRDLTEHATVFALSILRDAMPAIRVITGTVEQMMNNWGQVVEDVSRHPWAVKIFEGFDKLTDELATNSLGDIGTRISEGLFGRQGRTGVTLTPQAKARIGTPLGLGVDPTVKPEEAAIDAVQDMSDFKSKLVDENAGPGGVDTPVNDPQEHLRMLERKYGLPAGLLDRVWFKESSRGKNMLSPAGARGHFGFMPDTAKQYGIKGKENDFDASSDASARYYSDLLKMFGGDVHKAAAAYNWGPGHVQRLGMSRMPQETRDYSDFVGNGLQGGVNVNTEINIHGVSDPARAAELTKQKQSDVASDVVRNMSPRVR